MEQEPRKATDVLIDIETKVNALLDIVRAQDLVIKILSNKLNDVIGRLDKQQAGPPRIVVETVQAPPKPSNMPPGFVQLPAGDPDRVIPFMAESALPHTNEPQGFRRNSRPETYAPKSVPPIPKEPPPQKLGDPPIERTGPIQLPPGMSQKQQQMAGLKPPPGRGASSEVVVPPNALTVPGLKKGGKAAIIAPPDPKGSPVVKDTDSPAPAPQTGHIPVMQRCVDKNSKAIFLADVEIVDLSTMQPILKTRTNGAGKWQAPLGIGSYRVTIRKRENVTKEKIEAVQDIQVDGSVSKLELPLLIIK
jgi:hypothetical protein